MLTHIVRHSFRTARPTNFKLGMRMDDDDPHQRQAPWPQTSKIKGQGRKVTWSVWAVLAQCYAFVIRDRRGIRVGRTRRPHFLFICVSCETLHVNVLQWVASVDRRMRLWQPAELSTCCILSIFVYFKLLACLLYSIIDHGKMKGWVGLIGWL